MSLRYLTVDELEEEGLPEVAEPAEEVRAAVRVIIERVRAEDTAALRDCIAGKV